MDLSQLFRATPTKAIQVSVSFFTSFCSSQRQAVLSGVTTYVAQNAGVVEFVVGSTTDATAGRRNLLPPYVVHHHVVNCSEKVVLHILCNYTT